MIEDLFFKRYAHTLFRGDRVHPSVQRALSQAAQIFSEDIMRPFNLQESFFVPVQQQLTRELGSNPFPSAQSASEACARLLIECYDLWNNRHGGPDMFVKVRLSLVELLFRYAERTISERGGNLPRKRGSFSLFGRGSEVRAERPQIGGELADVVSSAIRELNARFQAAGVPLHYHNGLIQLAEDEVLQAFIAEPFWSVTRDPKWANVDHDMKRAVDLADTGGPDAVLYAAMALESTIKIISDEKGWTRGIERGAANYIDNLVVERAGCRFIDVWEKDMLLAIFIKLRNPHGHGPGSAPQPTLTDHQTRWAIEVCMSCIKSLIRRL